MKLVVAAVGRVKEPALRELLDDYYARIRRYAELTEVELRDERADRIFAATERVISSHGPRAELVALDAAGESLTSEAFAKRLGEMLDRAAVPVFAIGGAEGLVPEVRARARWTLSLGRMTLAHRIARLVLAEQVYRAFTILRGEPYNR